MMKQDLKRNGLAGQRGATLAAGMLAAALCPALAQAAEQAQRLDAVQVVGEQAVRGTLATGASSIGKMQQALRDIPQSVTVINQQLIEDQGADTLKDALKNVSGLTFAAGEGGRTGDQIVMRGFATTTDLFVDGARDIGQYTRDLFNTEKVEVLKGPSSMLFGRGSTGGVINLSSKQPYAGNQQQGELVIGTDNKLRATADINYAENDNMAVRLNVMAEKKNNGRTVHDDERYGFAPSIAIGLDGPTSLTLSYLHLTEHNNTDYGVPFDPNTLEPLDVPYKRYYGLSGLDYEDTKTDLATAVLEHRFSDKSKVKNQLRYARYERDAAPTAPRLSGVKPGMPVTDSSVMARSLKQRNGVDETWSNQTDFTTDLEFGGLRHQLLAGLELTRERSYTDRHDNLTGTSQPSTSVGAPNPADTPNLKWGKTSHRDYVADGAALYGQDFITLAPQWKALVGARFDHLRGDYRTQNFNKDSGALNAKTSYDASRSDNVWSWRTGLIWQPTAVQSYYASYGTSFNPSGETYALDKASEKVGPEKNRNMELGAKLDLLEGDLLLRGALFRIEKTNERNTDPLIPDVVTLSGKRHTDGAELEVAGRLNERWEVFAGATYLEASIDKAGSHLGTEGKRPRNTPNFTANLWTSYRITPEITAGGGANWVGKRYATEANTNVLPEYLVVSAMLAYETRHYKAQLNINNLLNEKHYEGLYGGHATYGAQRGAELTLGMKF
ncbi:TonB-dependent siderophore receptor [Craterilacuibacter sp. RT1T]|uniref:TonB-dependent receptor n=1 Tax=Craterilacuibacter sp. RT1T TaxID=2942211 RepID=UPI0020C0211B|nr:TonB-dependent siderophore receptor [Craterilacuibacter sp. RT1T]MCL6263495.1 TonB-dependent siderophore receptor [Craterilacuibacter sp. RT1T]